MSAAHHAIIVAAGSSRRLAHLTRERPKSLLDVGGRPLIAHGLEALARRGVGRLTLVVGYHADLLERTLGARHGSLRITYAHNADFDTTEHGWSLYQARAAWLRDPGPVLFLDADAFYDPALLDRALAEPHSTLVVEPSVAPGEEDELVLGSDGRVTGLRRGRARDVPGCVGAFVGVNRFSVEFTRALFEFMTGFFAANGRGHKYERVFDALVAAGGPALRYVDTGGRPWVNVNREADLERARAIASDLPAEGSGSGR